MAERELKHPRPFLLSLTSGEAPEARIIRTQRSFAEFTLGAMALTVRVAATAKTSAPESVLILPYDTKSLQGLDRSSVRVFRFDGQQRGFTPIWNSGINLALGFVWAKVARPGTYLPIGLPRDRLLQESLRALSYARQLQDSGDREQSRELTFRFLGPILDRDPDAVEKLRDLITRFEIRTTHEIPLEEYNFGEGGHPKPFHLPQEDGLEGFRERLAQLELTPDGLPEEQLFRAPELSPPGGTAWPMNPEVTHFEHVHRELFEFDPDLVVQIPWLFSKDWPMYQHDSRHSGTASGSSSITSTTVGQLTQRFKVSLDGPVNTKPSIVDGKAYIGTSKYGAGGGGTLYKIDICSGCIDGKFPTNDPAFYSISGIGGSPAIHKGKVYFTTVGGKVYCLDAASMTKSAPHPAPLWVTDLKNPSQNLAQAQAQNQPVSNPSGDCWSSPLLVKDKVYVGSGEGEVATCWGFTWCLDADTGKVIWLFCTNKAQNINKPGSENQPNKIPKSAAVSDPLPAWATTAGFSLMNDPPETGSSPWSSFAYDHVNKQVYVGTGNSQYLGGLGSAVAPDQHYGSGLIALDAKTGEFRGFHTSQPDDSYHPKDTDIDTPGAPTVFTRGGKRVVCYGCKNGSFFLLDAKDLKVLGGGSQRRQLLARKNGSGLPGDRGDPIPGVATSGAFFEENKWGVMATPAIHSGLGIIYVGLGGYSGAGDGTKTPFIRALNWNNLNDAWPTGPPGGDGVIRYSLANPPVYQRQKEAALSSPAVVNDVVFVSTTDTAPGGKMALYALDAATGLCLWAAPKVSGAGWPNYALGPAISGEYVVAGAANALYIYTRPSTPWCFCLIWEPWRWVEYVERPRFPIERTTLLGR